MKARLSLMSALPRLLVSVRNSFEAQLATAAGVQILDIKEPSRGSLGRADLSSIQEVVQTVQKTAPGLPVSAAWGELAEMTLAEQPPELPPLNYVKLGLEGMQQFEDWVLRCKLAKAWLFSRCTSANLIPGWIAVSYVDHQAARSPSPEEVLAAAIETDCAGVLFDTWSKSSGGLLDFLPPLRLESLVQQIHAAEMLTIAAGKVQLSEIRTLCKADVDVIAVRSAACASGDRTGELDALRIRELLAEIESCHLK